MSLLILIFRFSEVQNMTLLLFTFKVIRFRGSGTSDVWHKELNRKLLILGFFSVWQHHNVAILPMIHAEQQARSLRK